MRTWEDADRAHREAILAARARLGEVMLSDETLGDAARLCVALGTDGLRGELTLMRASRALAAFEGASEVTRAHLRAIASSSLRHRLRRDPLDEAGSGARVERVVAEVLPA